MGFRQTLTRFETFCVAKYGILSTLSHTYCRLMKKPGPLEAIAEEGQENVGPAEVAKMRTRVRQQTQSH